jgi:LCP family protein required for cell wall assembly
MATRAGDERMPPGSALSAPMARHGRLRPWSVRRRALGALGVVLSVLLVSTITVAGIAIWDIASSLKPGVSLPADASGGPSIEPNIGAIDGGVNLLLVGSDSGQGDPQYGQRGEQLGDVTILLHIAQDHSSATVVSFPRDLFVDIPKCPASAAENSPGTGGGFTDKLNAALSYGGLGCSVATIERLTGLTIPFAAKIEFNGVVEMSNAVGGVPVCVADPIDDPYTGLTLAAGEHVLQGADALKFLRTRHGLATGSDLARISNQQLFLSSLVRVIKSNGTLNDPLKLYSLAKAAASNMLLSTRLQSLDTMVSIAVALRGIDLGKVAFLQYPVVEVSGGVDALTNDAATLFNALAADTPVALSGQLGQGSAADPNAPTGVPVPPSPPPTTTPPSASPGVAQTSSPVPTAPVPASPPPASVELPPSISGQTAAEHTCTVGSTPGG